MRYFGRACRDRWAMLAAVAVPPALAAVLLPWRSSLANTDVALLLVITHSSDVETTVLLLAVGVAVSELAFRGRRARRTVAFSADYLRELRSVSDLVAHGRDPLDVAEYVRDLLIPLLELRTRSAGTTAGR